MVLRVGVPPLLGTQTDRPGGSGNSIVPPPGLQVGMVAKAAAPFQASQPSPAVETEGALLALPGDGKGISLRRQADAVRPADPNSLPQGEKQNNKRMAYVGASYTVDRFPRTADDVVNGLFGDASADPPERPEPQNKPLRAELGDEPAAGREALFRWLGEELAKRSPGVNGPVLFLADGELLSGNVDSVVRGLRQMSTKHHLRGTRAKTVASVTQYFENNRHRLKYDEYLAAGYPIGTGVVEGACRHLVKDRFERSGMRWSIPGAQAILALRATYRTGASDTASNTPLVPALTPKMISAAAPPPAQ